MASFPEKRPLFFCIYRKSKMLSSSLLYPSVDLTSGSRSVNSNAVHPSQNLVFVLGTCTDLSRSLSLSQPPLLPPRCANGTPAGARGYCGRKRLRARVPAVHLQQGQRARDRYHGNLSPARWGSSRERDLYNNVWKINAGKQRERLGMDSAVFAGAEASRYRWQHRHGPFFALSLPLTFSSSLFSTATNNKPFPGLYYLLYSQAVSTSWQRLE